MTRRSGSSTPTPDASPFAPRPLPLFPAFLQLRRMVLTLGSAFSIASTDITEKLDTLTKRIADIEAW